MWPRERLLCGSVALMCVCCACPNALFGGVLGVGADAVCVSDVSVAGTNRMGVLGRVGVGVCALPHS